MKSTEIKNNTMDILAPGGRGCPAGAGEGVSKGFTLIELLVVVLIVGILVSVAVPQYQKAVEKSRATQAFSLLKSVYEAQETFYLENGKYATKFNQLDIQIPWSGSTRWRTDSVTDTLSNDEWSLQIFYDGQYSSVSLGLLKGPYRGGGFVTYLIPRPKLTKGGIYCVERDTNGIVFDQQKGNYCSKLWNGTIIYNSNPVIFSMP